jgi:cytochrome c553
MLGRPRPTPTLAASALAGALLLSPPAAGDPPEAADVDADVRAVLALEPDVAAGERAYASCEACHGADGGGRTDGTFSRIAGQHRSVLVKQLVDIRAGRRKNPVMEPHAGALVDAQEIADVSAYIERLPPPNGNGQGDGEALETGRRLYARDCARCHGPHGEGDAAAFRPILAGQHYAYLLRQLRAIAGRRRTNGDPPMTHRVADYRDAELRAVADHLSRLAWPQRPAAP